MHDLVLVLNANFEPINVCNMHRAVGLILAEKATLIANGRGWIHTVRNNFPKPSVIRLRMMIRRPRPHVRFSRREIFRRDHYTCQYCGKKTLDLTVDHVIPRHMGGPKTWANVVAACYACNHHKGGRTLAEANMHLLHAPAEPPRSAEYIFGHHLKENSDWEPFITGW
jgi:5-methylcytosine-specific restriction endonuclease McrA